MIPIPEVCRRYRVFTREDLARIPQLRSLSREERVTMRAVSWVFPFRVNDHVLTELVDWSAAPDDPIFNLVFPQSGMLRPDQLSRMKGLVSRGATEKELVEAAREIQLTLNANPAGQKDLNVPWMDGEPLPGIQHKYRETVLFFPSAGQTCHSYCSYCFRWSQFARPEKFRFESHESDSLADYLKRHREATSVLITGGDPLVMGTETLRRYVEPLLAPSLDHVRSIRLGTKSLSYWPYRFVSDSDAEDLLELLKEIRATGRHVAVMAHVSHPRELRPSVTREAIRRIRATGAVIRTQAPIVRGVNDDSDTWATLWRDQVRLGMVPYYMFMTRDTGAQHFFKVPLAEALAIYNGALRQVSGLGRTARGPVMSATPGKVLVTGAGRVAGEDVFVLTFLQGRDPAWVGRPFFARYDPEAAWLDDLEPAFGKKEFFFEARFREIKEKLASGRGPEVRRTSLDVPVAGRESEKTLGPRWRPRRPSPR